MLLDRLLSDTSLSNLKSGSAHPTMFGRERDTF
jgi:hypothetical protein